MAPAGVVDEPDLSGSEEDDEDEVVGGPSKGAAAAQNGTASASSSRTPEEEVKEVTVDVSKLNPLSPEVISKQATINIGVWPPSATYRAMLTYMPS